MHETATPAADICAVILAGGRGRRMGGRDKALLPLAGWPLIAHVVAALRPQVSAIFINSNRMPADYAALGLPVIADAIPGQPGPLAGVLTALQACPAGYVLVVPCDMPRLPPDLVGRMREALERDDADVCSIDDGTRLHAAVMLLRHRVRPALERYLDSGQRRVQEWLRSVRHTTVDYSAAPDAFVNVNTPEQLQALGADAHSTPRVAFVADSGTGKTTLLERLIPLLRRRGLRLAALKHTHHTFDIDQTGKDSYRLRSAGADQVLVASRRRWALITELNDDAPEPDLPELLQALDHRHLDLILIEGFKHERIAKIELYRPALGKAPLYPSDPEIVAVASDVPLDSDIAIPTLDMNNPESIAEFIVTHIVGPTRPALDTPGVATHNDLRIE